MTEKRSKLKKIIKRILIFLAILLVLVGGACFFISKNPRVKLLAATLLFSETTLKNPEYLAYDLDLMELCQEYLNSDTRIYGKAYMQDIDGFGFSSSMEVDGVRSFSQKKMFCEADMKVLFLGVGLFDMYAEEDTLFLVVPMLDNLSYAFTTGNDLFKKAPELTSDISQEWFRENMGNIVELMGEISIEETGETYEADGISSKEYRMVIPKGSGQFIWDLLGIDAPDHDIKADIYITPTCRMQRIEMDLSESMEGVSMVLDGKNMNRCVTTVELPDNEKMIMTAVRKAKYTYINYMEMSMEYDANNGDVLTAETYCTWNSDDKGVELKIHDTPLLKNGKVMTRYSFIGRLDKIQQNGDVFAGSDVDFDSIERLEWKELRNDTQAFVDDVMAEVKRRTGF